MIQRHYRTLPEGLIDWLLKNLDDREWSSRYSNVKDAYVIKVHGPKASTLFLLRWA